MKTHIETLKALLQRHAEIRADIDRVKSIEGRVAAERASVVRAANFEDDCAAGAVMSASAKCELAEAKLGQLRSELPRLESELTTAIQETIAVMWRELAKLEAERFGQFRMTVEPFFPAGYFDASPPIGKMVTAQSIFRETRSWAEIATLNHRLNYIDRAGPGLGSLVQARDLLAFAETMPINPTPQAGSAQPLKAARTAIAGVAGLLTALVR